MRVLTRQRLRSSFLCDANPQALYVLVAVESHKKVTPKWTDKQNSNRPKKEDIMGISTKLMETIRTWRKDGLSEEQIIEKLGCANESSIRFVKRIIRIIDAE